MSGVAADLTNRMTRHLLQELRLLCGPVQSAYSRTERAEVAESVACRVFDTVPVAG